MRILVLAETRCDTPATRQTLKTLDALRQQGCTLDYQCFAGHAGEALAVVEREDIDAMLVTPGAANARQIERLAMQTGLFAAVHAFHTSTSGARLSPSAAARAPAFDIVLVSDPYQGQSAGHSEGRSGVVAQSYELVGANTLRYTETNIRLLAQVALDAAQRRSRRLVSVDQADRLETMELWRDVVAEAGARHPHVAVEHRLIEQAVAQLVAAPHRFDTILAGGNLGCVLAAQLGALTGEPSTWARALVGNGEFGIYEIASAGHASLPAHSPAHAYAPAVLNALSLMFLHGRNPSPFDLHAIRACIPAVPEPRPLGP